MKAPLCPVIEIPDEGAKAVDFFGRSVLVYKVNGRPRAIANVCLHLGGPLQNEGEKFVCAWHGAEYSRSNGRRATLPWPRSGHDTSRALPISGRGATSGAWVTATNNSLR